MSHEKAPADYAAQELITLAMSLELVARSEADTAQRTLRNCARACCQAARESFL